MTQKLQVIKVNPEYNIEILGTFDAYSDASEFLNMYIDKEFILNDYQKCVHNNHSAMTIYQYHYIFPKELVCKIHIIHYNDIE